MASTYQKPFKTFDDQLALLEQRGLVVEDRAEGISILRAVGYYTLGGYLYPMRKILPGTNPVHRLDQFLPGASMTLVASLYRFDRELRLLCLDALERIERAIKVAVAYQLGRHDKFAHDNGVLHDIKHLRAAPGARHSAHKEWNDAHKGKVRRRRHDSIQTFESKYGFPLPIWVAIDAMDRVLCSARRCRACAARPTPMVVWSCPCPPAVAVVGRLLAGRRRYHS